MKTQRVIVRWVHILCGIPIVGYIYSTPWQAQQYAFPTRYVFLPVMLLTGLWMWQGHLLRRLFARRPAPDAAAGT